MTAHCTTNKQIFIINKTLTLSVICKYLWKTDVILFNSLRPLFYRIISNSLYFYSDALSIES